MTEEITLHTSDGVAIQAELFAPDAPRAAVVITHPHPLMGGDMHTPVPSAFWRALPDLDAAGLRLNFRGVGKSTGTHDNGVAERLDVQAAVDRLSDVAADVPIVLAGWSFGADVSLAIDDDRIAGWFLAAAPLKVVDPSVMVAATSDAPKRFAVPEHDQFTSPDEAAETTAGWTNASISIIPGADHFFGAALPDLVTEFRSFIDAVASQTVAG